MDFNSLGSALVNIVVLSQDEAHLQLLIPIIRDFLENTLRLTLHPKKVIVRKLIQGIDFVGYVLFPHHGLVRTSTKQRMKRRLNVAYKDFLSGLIDNKQMDQRLHLILVFCLTQTNTN